MVPAPEPATGSLLDLLPESTLLAVEIHDAARRWSSLRDLPAIAGLQNRLLHGSGLEPDDLPLLAGNRAVVALVPTRDGRSVIPVAVLSPADPDRAQALMDVRAGARPDGEAAWCRVRGRNALWVGPANAAGDVAAVARGDGTSLGPLLPVAEAAKRLPDGGLARGWVNPDAVRRYLRRMVPGTHPEVIELAAAAFAAELDAARWIAFRRDLVDGRLVTDAVLVYDRAKLPVQVARVFDPGASAPSLPANLPGDVVLAAAFRLEPEACVPWLRFLAEADPRGPFRNLDFWIEEFEEFSGLSVQNDLFGNLGEHGWEILLESWDGEALQWAAVFEAKDNERVQAVLLALRDWSADQAWGRSFGLARLSPRVYDHDGTEVHATRIRTLLGELSGPAFAATGDHIVIGLGDRAVGRALNLVRFGYFGPEQGDATAPTAHASMIVRGPGLARTLETLVDSDSRLFEAVVEFLYSVPEASAQTWYETDGLRVHGELVLGE